MNSLNTLVESIQRDLERGDASPEHMRALLQELKAGGLTMRMAAGVLARAMNRLKGFDGDRGHGLDGFPLCAACGASEMAHDGNSLDDDTACSHYEPLQMPHRAYNYLDFYHLNL